MHIEEALQRYRLNPPDITEELPDNDSHTETTIRQDRTAYPDNLVQHSDYHGGIETAVHQGQVPAFPAVSYLILSLKK